MIELRKANLSYSILFQNRDVIAVDKPAGLAVQGGRKLKSHLSAMLREALPQITPQAVHRIDAATSGVVLFATSPQKIKKLKEKWNLVEKRYLAVVKGRFQKKHLTLTSVVYAHEKQKEARTQYEVLGAFGPFSLLSASLMTGRKHQIRKQLSEAGHPILGDDKYGDFELNREWALKLAQRRLFLHSWKMTLPPHDRKMHKKSLCFEAKLPALFKELLSRYNALALIAT